MPIGSVYGDPMTRPTLPVTPEILGRLRAREATNRVQNVRSRTRTIIARINEVRMAPTIAVGQSDNFIASRNRFPNGKWSMGRWNRPSINDLRRPTRDVLINVRRRALAGRQH